VKWSDHKDEDVERPSETIDDRLAYDSGAIPSSEKKERGMHVNKENSPVTG